MKHDLSNARIIEWDSDGWPSVGARAERGDVFVTTNGRHDILTEAEAFGLGARVVAEFPAPSLAERVGDAPAFLFENCGESYIAYRVSPVTWVVRRGKAVESFTHSYLGLDAFQADYHKLDPASVVPLFPREVSS